MLLLGVAAVQSVHHFCDFFFLYFSPPHTFSPEQVIVSSEICIGFQVTKRIRFVGFLLVTGSRLLKDCEAHYKGKGCKCLQYSVSLLFSFHLNHKYNITPSIPMTNNNKPMTWPFHPHSIPIAYLFHTHYIPVPYPFPTHSLLIPYPFHTHSIPIPFPFRTHSIPIPYPFHTHSKPIPYPFYTHSIPIPIIFPFHTLSCSHAAPMLLPCFSF